MFKVNNKNRPTSLTPFSSVSIVDFEQANISWAASKQERTIIAKSSPQAHPEPCQT